VRVNAEQRARLVAEGAGRFRLEGEVGFVTVMRLLEESRRLFADEERIRLDLSGVERINSAGLALVIEWIREARREGREIAVSKPPQALMAIARICEVEDILAPALAGSESAAVS